MKPGARGGRKRLFLILAAGALVVALVVGAVYGRPVIHWYKRWRALQLTEASMQALRANDLATAESKANAAYLLWPFDPRVSRQVAMVMDSMKKNPEQAELLWATTYKLSLDNDDLRHWIDAELVVRNIPGAMEEYGHLSQLDPANPQTALTGARVLLADNEWPKALDVLQKLLDSGQAPDEALLLYVQATSYSNKPEDHLKGTDLLRKLSSRSDQLGLGALRMLSNLSSFSYPGETPDDAKKLADLLQNHPLATLDDKLAALSLLGQLPGANEDSLVQDARKLFPAGDPDELVDVGRWLIGRGQNAAVLKLIDSDTALTRRDLFLIRLDALAGVGNWQAVDDALRPANLPIPEELRLLFKTRTLRELGQPSDLAWDKIISYVGNEPAKLRDVAEYAMKLDEDDVARKALRKLIDLPNSTQRRAAYDQLVYIERYSSHDTKALHDVLLEMQRIYLNDPVVANDVLYTGFLLGDAAPDKIAAAQRIAAPNAAGIKMLSYLVTLALGQLTAHNPAAAAQALDGVTWTSTTEPSWLAVEVGVLRANGHPADADALAKTININVLLPEERALLTPPLPLTP